MNRLEFFNMQTYICGHDVWAELNTFRENETLPRTSILSINNAWRLMLKLANRYGVPDSERAGMLIGEVVRVPKHSNSR